MSHETADRGGGLGSRVLRALTGDDAPPPERVDVEIPGPARDRGEFCALVTVEPHEEGDDGEEPTSAMVGSFEGSWRWLAGSDTDLDHFVPLDVDYDLGRYREAKRVARETDATVHLPTGTNLEPETSTRTAWTLRDDLRSTQDNDVAEYGKLGRIRLTDRTRIDLLRPKVSVAVTHDAGDRIYDAVLSRRDLTAGYQNYRKQRRGEVASDDVRFHPDAAFAKSVWREGEDGDRRLVTGTGRFDEACTRATAVGVLSDAVPRDAPAFDDDPWPDILVQNGVEGFADADTAEDAAFRVRIDPAGEGVTTSLPTPAAAIEAAPEPDDRLADEFDPDGVETDGTGAQEPSQ